MHQPIPSETTRAGLRASGLILAAIGVAIGVYNWKTVAGMIKGPSPISPTQLRDLTDPNELPTRYVTFTTPQVVDTGVKLFAKRSRRVTWQFLLAQVEDRWLIVKANPDFAGNRLTGYLQPRSTTVDREAFVEINALVGKARDRLLPYHIDAANDEGTKTAVLLGLAGILLVVGLVTMAQGPRNSASLAPLARVRG